LAAFFAMIPAAMAIQRGSEANAPLARAILGGLAAGVCGTLFVLPALYSTLVRDRKPSPEVQQPAEAAVAGHAAPSDDPETPLLEEPPTDPPGEPPAA
jgi:hypothetical protein